MVSNAAGATSYEWWRNLIEVPYPIDPTEDGFIHINIWTKAQTPLGRGLTNLANIPLIHPRYGYFSNMEGYWYWVVTGMQFDELRDINAWRAKSTGKRLPRVTHPEFERLICEGLMAKLEQTPWLKQALLTCPLPLHHYYNYGGHVVVPDAGIFQVLFLEDYRRMFR